MSDRSREANIALGAVRLVMIGVGILIWIGVMTGGPSDNSSESSDSIVWDTYDVEIDVREDGSLHVAEHQDVTFDGSFSKGYAEIPLDRVESIDNFQITTEGRVDRDDSSTTYPGTSSSGIERDGEMHDSEEVDPEDFHGEANTFAVQEIDGRLRVDYAFESTSGPYSYFSEEQTRTIFLEYDVYGAIRDYPDAEEPWQQVHWLAISDEVLEVADIRQATVTLNLPEDVPADQLGPFPEPEMMSATRIDWPARELSEGDSYDVQVRFPAMTAATAPQWQEAADQYDAAVEDGQNRDALASVMLIGAGILTVVAGGLFLLYSWFTRIRESYTGLVADILSEAPDDLPAGLVGALVDEQVHPSDVAAVIFDLDRRGIVKIQENEGQSGSRFGSVARYTIALQKPIEEALPHEQVVLRAIFRSSSQPPALASFDALRPLFSAYREDIQTAMDQELVRRGYYVETPSKSRDRWELSLKVVVGLAVAFAIAILVWTQRWSWYALVAPALGLVVYKAGQRLTPSIASKTPQGMEAAAKWRAFERYLKEPDWQVHAGQRADIQEKNLPWAIAFGMEQQWLSRMNSAYSPFGRQRSMDTGTTFGNSWASGSSSHRGHLSDWSSGSGSSWSGGTGGWSLGSGGSSGGWNPGEWPDLQGSSNNVLGAIQSGGDSMFSMLGDAMEALGSSSGGGGSSGGRSSGGRSFGGGSSRSRSSSGGGSRGFS